MMTEDLLDLDQIDAGLDEVGSIAVAQAVRGDLFLIPQDSMTWCKALCTPLRSRGLVARAAPSRPP